MSTRAFGISFVLGATLASSVVSTFKTVEEKAQDLRNDLATKRAKTSKAEAVVRTGAELAALKKQRAAASESDREMLDARIAGVRRKWAMATFAARKHGLSVAQCAAEYKSLQSEITRAEAKLLRLEKRQTIAAKRAELRSGIVDTVATVAAVAAPVKMALDFESAFADVRKVVDFANAAEEQGAQKDIRRLSTRTGLAATDISAIYAAAGAAKLATTREELAAFAETAARMAVAFGTSADDAGQKMASWRSKMNLTQAEVVALADAVNHLGNNMAADPLKTSEVVERVGAVARGAGLAANQIAALSASFVAAAPSPEIAATGMKNFLLALSKGSAMSRDQQAAFARIGFGDPKQLARDMQADAEGTIQRVLAALKRMPAAEQGSLLAEMFGTESQGAISPLLQNLELVSGAFRNVAKASDFAGSMTQEYENRSRTAQNALNRLVQGVKGLGIVVGSVVLPPLAAVSDALGWALGPVTAAAEACPVLTTAVVGVAAGLAVFKVAALGAGFAVTLVSDGWLLAKGVLAALHPQVLATNFALAAQRVVALATAVGTKALAVAQWTLNAAMTANPVGLVVAGVVALGAAVWALYTCCEPVRRAVDGLWSGVKAGAVAVWDTVVGAWQGIKSFFSGLTLEGVGSALMQTLAKGLLGGVLAPVQAVAWVVDKVREYLPGSDAERGPLAGLTASGAAIPRTMARGMRQAGDGGMGEAFARGAGEGLDLRLSGRGAAPTAGSGGIQVTFAPTIHLAGGPADQAGVTQALQLSEARLREMLERLLHDDRRLAYG